MKHLLLTAAAVLGLGLTTSCEPEETLSNEAEITSFTFDASVEANSIVTTAPEINGEAGTISFNVTAEATDAQLAGLVPTVTVSENATVTPASGSTVDFSKGPVTFTVTAQDGVTTRNYTATATREEAGIDPDPEPVEPAEPVYPIADSLAGEYKGRISHITVGGVEVAGNIPKNITVAEVSDTTISVSMKDFSIIIEGAEIPVGDIEVSPCRMGFDEDHYYTFEGTQIISVSALNMDFNATVAGKFNRKGLISININLSGAMEVAVKYTGAKLNGDESSEALITSFTINDLAGVITSDPVIDHENWTVTFGVAADITDEQLAAIHPEVTVSEGATWISPSVDYSKGPVVYTVIAEDGTVNNYTATAVKDEATETLDGIYSGTMSISVDGTATDPFTDEIIISQVAEDILSLTIEDFTFLGFNVGDVTISKCAVTETEDGYSISGKESLTLSVDMGMEFPVPMTAEAEITEGTIGGGKVSLALNISADMMGMATFAVVVEFDGTKTE